MSSNQSLQALKRHVQILDFWTRWSTTPVVKATIGLFSHAISFHYLVACIHPVQQNARFEVLVTPLNLLVGLLVRVARFVPALVTLFSG